MQITRSDTTPELWEKLRKQCHMGNADVIEIQVVGSTVYSKDDPRKTIAMQEDESPRKNFPEYDKVVNAIEVARPDDLKLTQDHYFGIRLCYDYLKQEVT